MRETRDAGSPNMAAILRLMDTGREWITSVYDVSNGGCSILAPNSLFGGEELELTIYMGSDKRREMARVRSIGERKGQVRYFIADCEFCRPA